ncbi:hypothetical protein Mkiyose1413_15930 [Mycobacterium kiyosense]|uniref:Uncharacterized protein n=1 Tax=Mycobacterium kiyosense TaxID=2871094 RepID=A0A9P3Q5L2_9MYCO|nr:hypothetical protein Mkiyose1413_15930 [Mycobacterium kiyosense]
MFQQMRVIVVGVSRWYRIDGLDTSGTGRGRERGYVKGMDAGDGRGGDRAIPLHRVS